MFKFFKMIRTQAQKIEAMFSSMKWLGMIRYDNFDEEWEVNKPNGVQDGIQMTLPMLVGNVKTLLHRDEEIKKTKDVNDETISNILDRLKAVEEKEERNHNNTVVIDKLIAYFFVADHFADKTGMDAGCDYPKFGDFIPKETAVEFQKLEKGICFSDDVNLFYVQNYYTSSKNAIEHKATIARYEIEVANFNNRNKEIK